MAAPESSPAGVLKRTNSSLKPAMREKFVAIYEDIFALSSPVQQAREQGISGRASLQRFWDELLLLKVTMLLLQTHCRKVMSEVLLLAMVSNALAGVSPALIICASCTYSLCFGFNQGHG